MIMDQLRTLYSVSYMCEMFDISRSSYYKWISNGRARINRFNEAHAKIIEEEHIRYKQVYGVNRLKHAMAQTLGICFNHKKIRRYLRLIGLNVIVRKRKGPQIVKQKKRNHMNMASNLINNNFTSKAPHHKLSTDVSYIKCTEGTLYLSVVKDLFNNEIIAHSMSMRNNLNLVLDTINQIPNNEGIIHSDQGSQYYSLEYINVLTKKGYKRSMSRKGACWENSPVENWFSQLKQERLYPIGVSSVYKTIKEIKKYVQWYNTERIQANLKYMSPLQFKTA